MDPEKKTEPASESEETPQPKAEVTQAPVDALSLTPEELEEEAAEAKANSDTPATAEIPEKKLSPIKRFFRKVNVYFLFFIILIIIASAITVVNYLNSQKAPVEPNIATQDLTEDALKQLANSDATVGNSSQTLTIQGNAIITGQTLMRGNLNIAGNLQTGGSIQGPSLTISGKSNLGDTQINNLQIATNLAVQGTTSVRDLNIAGTSNFSGAVTASQITVTRLILSGNAVLQIPNHISFTGGTPVPTANPAVLGNGGSASLSGSDTAGTVTINSGNNPTPGCLVKITFQQPFTSQPRVIVGPISIGAGQIQYYVERNNTTFSICTVNAAPNNQTFGFDYFITN